MAYRVEWRARTPKGVPSTIHFEDSHDLESATHTLNELLSGQVPCWVWIEDLESPHRGNSLQLPKPRAIKGAKR